MAIVNKKRKKLLEELEQIEQASLEAEVAKADLYRRLIVQEAALRTKMK
jgi:hypothetical protein